jgi:thiol-disulfide isomerase/thioredoxin
MVAVLVVLATLLGATGDAKARPEPARIISLGQLGATMKGHRGRVLVLHFWASWCAPCLKELPQVERFARDTRRRGVDVVSVSLDEPSAEGAAAVALALAEQRVERLTRVILRLDNRDAVIGRIDPEWEGTIPALFAYDRKGKLHRSHVGELAPDTFEELVGRLVSKPVK